MMIWLCDVAGERVLDAEVEGWGWRRRAGGESFCGL
jgi:hypothetical protein